MELIHNYFLYGSQRALAQGNVRQNFRRAAKDGGIPINRGIASAEADIFRAKFAAKREPFFIDECFDGAGVDRSFVLSDCFEMQSGGNERFARSGGGI